MNKLNDDQIKRIAEDVAKSKAKSKELIEDLTDHISCLIEDDLNNGFEFKGKLKDFEGDSFEQWTCNSHDTSVIP